jgi:hypothetical protein
MRRNLWSSQFQQKPPNSSRTAANRCGILKSMAAVAYRSNMTRHPVVLIALLAVSAVSSAECPPRICYAVSFEITDCHLIRGDLPKASTGQVTGTVLTGRGVTTRAVPCSASASIPARGRPLPDEMQRRTIFRYTANSCGGLIGKNVELFQPDAYFVNDADKAQCPVLDERLVALPTWVQ